MPFVDLRAARILGLATLAGMIDTIDVSMILILKVAWHFEFVVPSFYALTDSLEFELKKDKI